MRQPFIFFLSLLCTGQLPAQVNNKPKKDKLAITAAVGYTQQDFNWSIAESTDSESSQVLSELKWNNTGGLRVKIGAAYMLYKKASLNFDYSNSFTSDGTATDTDYNAGGTNASSLNSDKGGTREIKLGLGYHLLHNRKWVVAIRTGYGIYLSNYKLLDKNRKHVPEDERLNTSYNANWRGVYIGIHPAVAITNSVELNGGIEYSQVRYNAKADWNLIEQFQHPISFTHKANGYGLSGESGVNFYVNRTVALGVNWTYFMRETGTGVDKLFLKSGETRTTRFNDSQQNGMHISFTGKLML